ncbi:hypothetical protein ABT56_23075 [Photobacterium aquae]|uniref:Uncharacterized protein n=1 Tax=Photobacterium aquae TaxID=1195763 RepID=A0A0J1GHG2_9GAMM|nr:hypothetical protein ABT56_23075 [Photobacterium aquae]
MVRAVDLNKLTKTITAVTRLVNTRLTLGVRNPEAVCDHPLTERFNRNMNVMAFSQFFMGKCWTKVCVMFTDQNQTSKFH